MKRRNVRIALGTIALIGLIAFWMFRDFAIPQRTALIESDEFILYSLSPIDDYPDHENLASYLKNKKKISGSVILGEMQIKDIATRAKLIDAMYQGINASDGTSASCFNPRHAIMARKGRRNISAVICFECMNIYVEGKYMHTARTPQKVFDEVLRIHKIPLGKREQSSK